MCSNYLPVTRANRLMTFFGVEYAKDELLPPAPPKPVKAPKLPPPQGDLF